MPTFNPIRDFNNENFNMPISTFLENKFSLSQSVKSMKQHLVNKFYLKNTRERLKTGKTKVSQAIVFESFSILLLWISVFK